MTKPLLILTGLLSTLLAQPGDLLPSQFPDLSAQALVTSAVTTPDGSTFLMGNFTEVDGITRPGLAKLTPSGHLDQTFAPPAFSALDFQVNPPTYFFSNSPQTREPLFPLLQRGGLIVTSPFQWELRNTDGTLNTTLLSQFPRNSDTPPFPQFERDGRLLIIAHLENLVPSRSLLSLDSETLLTDPNFNFTEDYPAPPLEASPAANGSIWILGRDSYPLVQTGFYNNPPAHYLYRILPDGSLDPSFTPERLKESDTHSLVPNPGPGLQLASRWPNRHIFWPSPSHDGLTFETRDAQGLVIKTTAGSFNFGLSPFHHLLPDGRLLAQSLDYGDLAITDSITLETSLRIPLHTPATPPETRTLTQFSEGKFLVGGNRRILTDGTPDPTWHTARLSRPATITHLIPLQDNTILAVGDFDLANGLPRSGAIKLNQDTTFDPTFNPGHDIRNARSIHQKQNGTLVVHLNHPYQDTEGNSFHLIELSSTGALKHSLTEPNTNPYFNLDGSRQINQSNITSITLQSDDSLLVFAYFPGEVSRNELIRVKPNGDQNSQQIFAVPSITLNHPLILFPDDRFLLNRQLHAADGTPLDTFSPDDSRPLSLLPDGSLLVQNTFSFPDFRLQKWHPDLGIDPTFSPQSLPPTFQNYFWNASLAANEKILTSATLYLESTDLTTLHRLHSTGQSDPTFHLTFESIPDFSNYLFNPADPVIHPIDSPSGPLLWLAGPFTKINGQPASSLNLIDDSTTPDFHTWMHATAKNHSHTPADLLPTADPDHDGATNLFEYAASTDPFQASPSHALPQQSSPLTFQIPCNPDAPEILRQLQTSNDLITWSPARADQVRLETSASCLTWRLLPNAPKTFTRLHILTP